jgi:wyosine [tRNA(Phe)-imidazoG37] synthetase (radical SAM superfamily)
LLRQGLFARFALDAAKVSNPRGCVHSRLHTRLRQSVAENSQYRRSGAPGGSPYRRRVRRGIVTRVIRGYTSAVNILNAHRQHPRHWESFKYVYPVLSRRSHGISIGINTNPDKVCNFDCIYCQVDRTVPSSVQDFNLAEAEQELRALIEMAQSGELAQSPPFDSVPRELLRVNDVALSGDAEPTTLKNFSETVAMIARVKPKGVKIVLITDAGGLDRPDVKRGLEIMDANDGEVWAKLDAGTEEYFKLVNRTKIPFAKILKNIAVTAKAQPIVIQSLFMKVHGVGPSVAEIAAYCQRLNEIVAAGGHIKLVQIYTIARKPMTVVDGVPAWEFVTALSNEEVDAIAARVRTETGLATESYHGM